MRRLLVLVVLTVVAVGVLATSVTAESKRNARSGVAIYQLADPAGEGQVRGLGVIVQNGKKIRWWVSGSGLTPGLHAQHIHGPGNCEANAPIILPLPDINVQADGSFFASGRIATKLKIAAGRRDNYWNVHTMSTAAGVGPGVTCGERIKISSARNPGDDDNRR